MLVLRRIAAEIVGLFVDDGLLAAAALAWVVAALLARRLGLPDEVLEIALFAGPAAMLVASARLRAGRDRRLNRDRWRKA